MTPSARGMQILLEHAPKILEVETPLGIGEFMLAKITTGTKKTIRYLVWVPMSDKVELNWKSYHCIRKDKKRALIAFTAAELGLEEQK